MIVLLIGGIGSGKSLSIVRNIVINKEFAFTNFKLNNIKDYHRIKFSDIISTEGKGKDKESNVNWEFWQKARKQHKNYCIYLDEVHNIIHSRRSMSNTNILMSKWISQIRKILSDSETNHIYLISQTLRKIDVDFRELANIIIVCKRVNINGKIWIKQYWYDSIMDSLYGKPKAIVKFSGDKYFKYYDTTDMVTFGDAEEFI